MTSPRPALLLLALVVGCGHEAVPSSTSPASTTPPGEAVPASADAQVDDWLARAAGAPHNGSNPELALPPELVRDGATAFQRAVASGPIARRRDAASALSRHPEPASQRTFWLTQLESDDATVRFYALTSIAETHASEDFEPFVRAAHTHGDTRVLAVRARDFGDRRAVPLLVDLLASPADAENAALSLSMLPGVPDLPEEQVEPAATAEHLPGGAWRAPATSRVAPYQRWWQGDGRAAFATECAWWQTVSPASAGCAAER
jgi:hypothetical protein